MKREGEKERGEKREIKRGGNNREVGGDGSEVVRVTQTRLFVAINAIGCRVGETHHRAKLTDSDIWQILELREMGLSYRAIAEKFDDIPGGISKSTVRDIVKCRIRAQVPTSFKRCG